MKKIAIFHFVYTLIIYKYQPIGTKLSQNIYDKKISNEFEYRSNWTGTTGIALEFKKKCYISLFLHSSIYKYQPVGNKLLQNIYMTIKSLMSLNLG